MQNKLIFVSYQILEGIKLSVNETSTGFLIDSRGTRLMIPLTDFQDKDCKEFPWGAGFELKYINIC